MFTPSPCQSIPEHYTLLVKSLCEIAEAYFYQGRLSDAVTLLEQGAEIVKQSDVTDVDRNNLLVEYIKLLITRTVTTGDGSFDRALALLEQVQAQANTPVQQAAVRHLRGMPDYWQALKTADKHEREQGLRRALEAFLAALKDFETLQDTAGQTLGLFWTGLVYQHLEELDTAESYFARALRMAQAQNYAFYVAEAYRHLGVVSQVRNDLTLAQQYHQQARDVHQAIGYIAALPYDYNSLGRIAAERGDSKTAHQYYDEAHLLAEQMNLQHPQMFARLYQGILYEEQGESQQAKDALSQALPIAQRLDDRRAVSLIEQLLS